MKWKVIHPECVRCEPFTILKIKVHSLSGEFVKNACLLFRNVNGNSQVVGRYDTSKEAAAEAANGLER